MQTQRPETRSYHAGNANNDSLGVSLIGRFMRRNWNGTPIPTDQQLPTPQQMDSTARLVAWLMKEHGITAVTKIVGHKEVSDTSCPGDQWLEGANWKQLLHGKIEAIRQAPPHPVYLMLMFWQHGDQWAEADWRSAQAYIAHFRPATTFTPGDGFAARHVVIVGGDAGVSGQDEARLRAAGVDVHRLAGANEAQTKAMLDALVAADTPWPGAPRIPEQPRGDDTLPADPPAGPDEWTVPDDYQPEVVRTVREAQPPPPQRVMVDSLAPSRPVTLPNQPGNDEAAAFTLATADANATEDAR
ncbi:MAG: peptidoglycan recognition family protein [Caldilineales bacterium]